MFFRCCLLLCFRIFFITSINGQCFIPDVNVDYCQGKITYDLTSTENNVGGTYEYFEGFVPILAPNVYPLHGFAILDGVFTEFGTGCVAEFKITMEEVLMPTPTFDQEYIIDCTISIVELNPQIIDDVTSTYLWYSDQGEFISNDLVIVVSEPGDYTFIVQDNNFGCEIEETVTVINYPEFTVSDELNCDSTATLTASPIGGTNGLSIYWEGPGIIGANDQFEIIIDTIGIYTVSIVNHLNGCINTNFFEITTLDCVGSAAPSLLQNQTLSVYPNPFSNHLQISYDGIIQGVVIADHLGKIVVEKNGGSKQWELPFLSPGLYFIGVESEGELFWQRIVKQ